jgi:hypothetical protein
MGFSPLNPSYGSPRNRAAKRLFGPTVQYADGTVIPGEPLDIEHILTAFKRLDTDARSAFLCIFARDLTVAVRTFLLDRPVPDAHLEIASGATIDKAEESVSAT